MSFGPMPVYFIENRGQTDYRAAYYIRGKDKSIYFTSEGVAFSLAGGEREKSGMFVRASYGNAAERWLLKLEFVGAKAVVPVGEEATPAMISYFKGPKEDWKAGVKTYAKLVYADLWPGIDLVYSGTSDRLKYEFVVKPGADPKRIQLAYRGASSVNMNTHGELEIATPAGTFRDDRPLAYQESAGGRAEVAMRYRLKGDSGAYGFDIGAYDRGKPLVLDPAIFIYSGFIGGAGDDRANGIAVDGDGAAYITGETASDATTFPETSGAFDRSQNGGVDAFVAKVKPDGSGLIYATFIGGAGDDRGLAIALEQSCATACAAYITGETHSNEDSFPVTTGAFQTARQGGTDAFVAKIDPDGMGLGFVTYFGGSADERGKGIAVDGAGNIFITGETRSTENSSPNPFPTLTGPFVEQGGGGNFDAFVAKLLPDGSDIVFSGFIGGAGDDRGNAIALEPSCSDPCDIYIAGETNSGELSFPVTAGPDLTHNSGIDGFVAKVSGDGSGLIYAGYIGGNLTDRANGIAVDSANKAYVAGETSSDEGSFPNGDGFAGALPGFNKTQNGGVDAFVVRVKDDGTGLEYATYIGGSGDDRANTIAIAPGCISACFAFVAGETNSDQSTFPNKTGPDTTFNGGIDGFIAVVDTSSTTLVSAGYIGGAGDDRANAVAADAHGSAYVAGESGALPVGSTVRFTTKSGPDTSQNGGIDAFVAKICTTVCLDLTLKMSGTPTTITAAGTITYSLTVTNKGPQQATNVTVTDVFPAGAVFVPGSVACTPSVSPITVTCALGTLAKGDIVLLTFGMTPAAGGTLANTANVSSSETDIVPSNNASTVKTKVIFPDLVVKKISVDMTTVPVGGSFNVTDTTANNQAAPALASTTAFYLSTDKTLAGAVLLTSRSVVAFPGKGSTAATTTLLTIPLLTTPGAYFIVAAADDGNAVDEGINEGNNTKASKKITVSP